MMPVKVPRIISPARTRAIILVVLLFILFAFLFEKSRF